MKSTSQVVGLPQRKYAGAGNRSGRKYKSELKVGRPYVGGRSSPFNQPVPFSVFRGSGPSQSKHRNVRSPLPAGGSARTAIF
jgi:hypothetical protein